MLNKINFNQLYYFWFIAREESLKKAASHLHLAQPTLSIQLRQLEKKLGVPLFIRQGKRLILAPAGEIVLKHCNTIFNQSNLMLDELSQNKSVTKHYVKVGVAPYISKSLLTRVLRPILDQENAILSLVENEPDILFNDIEIGKLDFIFLDNKISKLPKSIMCKKIIEDDFVAVMDEKNYKKTTFPNCLNNLKFISFTLNSKVHKQCQKYFVKKNINVQTFAEIDDITLIKLILQKYPAFSILPNSSIQTAESNNRLKTVGKIEGIKSDIFIYAFNQNNNPLTDKIMKNIGFLKGISKTIVR